MKTLSITKVKASFVPLVEAAAAGDPFVISVAGLPKVAVRPLTDEERRAWEQGNGPDDAEPPTT